MKVETRNACLQALSGLQVKDEHLMLWFDAVYANPSMTYVRQKSAEVMDTVTLEDIIAITEVFVGSGLRAGVTKTVDYFRRLLEIEQDIQIITHGALSTAFAQHGGCCYYGSEFKDSELIRSELWIGYQLRNRPVHAYLTVISHELWHAYQVMQKRKLLCAAQDGRLSDLADTASQGLLYLVGLNHIIQVDDDREAYEHQLIEQEAYFFFNCFTERLEQLFRDAYLQGKINRYHDDLFHNLPIFQS